MIGKLSTRAIGLAVLTVLVLGQAWMGWAEAVRGKGSRPVVARRVRGNRYTKPWVILRELRTRVGESPDSTRLAEDCQRVLNLQLFERVEISLEPGPDGDTLTVHVWERWYFFPYPMLFANERDLRKLSYGLGLVHMNLAGRAQVLSANGWAGYNPAVQAEYYNPWLAGTAKLFCDVVASLGSVKSKSLEFSGYTERKRAATLFLGKRFGYGTYLATGLTFADRTLQPQVPGVLLSPKGRDRFATVVLHFRADVRDFRAYAWNGWYAKVQFEEEGIGSPWVSYRQLLIDLRAYSGGTAASIGGRLATALSFGRVPPYDRVYLGYEERVRGHFFTRREGEGQALFSLEWKHVLLPLRYWDSPLPSVLLPTLKFGLNLALFADGGVVWRQGQLPWRLRWLRGCGAGLHLRLPYIEVLRLEAAVNEKGRLQAIVDIGSSF